jgi:hypothetical protein
MTCTQLTAKLDDYVDGLMDRAESEAVMTAARCSPANTGCARH